MNQAPVLAAIVLAAGAGSRFGGGKLSASFKGEPLISHTIRAALAAPVSRTIVIATTDLDIGDWDGVEVRRIATTAMSDSLRSGVSAAGDSDGAFVFLGDMPLVPHDAAARLAEALGGNYAAMPRFEGRPGHPVLLSRIAFADIARLEGDQGAGALIRSREDVAFLDWPDDTVLLDVDRANDIKRLESRM
ncbi:MAG: nucleotidyltransferase family protein [Novosphingobium sp.]